MRYLSRSVICSIALALGLSSTIAMATAVAGTSTAAQPGMSASAVTPAAWSAPVKIGNGLYRSISEVVDSTNHVNIAASGHGGVWYMTDRSGTWTKTRVLKDLHNRSYHDVSIALDGNDRVYIAAERFACDDCVPGSTDGIFLVTDKGHARGHFSASPLKIAPAGSGEPSLKVNGGHVFLAEVDRCCQPGPLPPVFLRTNASGQWTQSRVAKHGDAPLLRIGSDGRPRVAFSKPRAIGYAVGHSVTGSFTASDVPDTGIGDNLMGFALDSHDQPHLLFMNQVTEAATQDAGSATVSAVYAWHGSSGWKSDNVGPLGSATNALAFDLDSQGHARVAAGGGSVLAFVRRNGHWAATTVAASADVNDITLRRAFNGHAVIAYTNFNAGLWVSNGN